jgi:hypothetical protein
MTTSYLRASRKGMFPTLQPASAWVAILGLVVITAALVAAGAGKVVNLAFPAASLLIGVFLYHRAPLLYTGFTWWLWFLAPLVRRLADYRSSYTEPSPILLAPFLVTAVSLITLWKYLPKINRGGGGPFILALSGLVYGLLIGLINKSPYAAIKDFLDWAAPVAFGFHLWVNWRHYPSYRQNIGRIFTWAILGMGIYGIVQFTALPDWDSQWLTNAEFNVAVVEGLTDPSQKTVRVWGTMQSGEPFSAFMAGALLLLLISKESLAIPASVVGYLSFLLAMVRSGWIGWVAGVLTLLSSLKPKFQIRLVSLMVGLALCLIPLATMEPFAASLNDRLNSFSDVENDTSAQARQDSYSTLTAQALTSIIGIGLGGGSIDSAIFAMLFYLGWIGTIPYVGSMFYLLWRLFKSPYNSLDPFIGVARSVVITTIIRMPLNGSNTGVSGLLLWSFLALGLAAGQYYELALFKSDIKN